MTIYIDPIQLKSPCIDVLPLLEMKKVCSGYTNDGMLYMHHLQKLWIQFIRLLQHVQFASISFLKERLQPCVYHLPIELPRSDEQHKCNGRPKQAHTGHDQKR